MNPPHPVEIILKANNSESTPLCGEKITKAPRTKSKTHKFQNPGFHLLELVLLSRLKKLVKIWPAETYKQEINDGFYILGWPFQNH